MTEIDHELDLSVLETKVSRSVLILSMFKSEKEFMHKTMNWK